MNELRQHPGGNGRRRKPEWLRVRAPGGDSYTSIKAHLRDRGLHTVCEEARCPNVGECWGGGTATFMILGDTCTRGCRFCAVKTGNPGGVVDLEEPEKLADAVDSMDLSYVVLTMVDRDDLLDGGAAHVAASIIAIKRRRPEVVVEGLVGDFAGQRSAVGIIGESGVDVFSHNIETVERLQRTVRDRRSDYRRSLRVLRMAREIPERPYTKSSIMLGLGETEDEVIGAMRDLRAVGVEFLTLGQYLQPNPKLLPVEEYVHPESFERLARTGEDLGFRHVASGPLVRSSYRAGEYFIRTIVNGRRLRETGLRIPQDRHGGQPPRSEETDRGR